MPKKKIDPTICPGCGVVGVEHVCPKTDDITPILFKGGKWFWAGIWQHTVIWNRYFMCQCGHLGANHRGAQRGGSCHSWHTANISYIYCQCKRFKRIGPDEYARRQKMFSWDFSWVK